MYRTTHREQHSENSFLRVIEAPDVAQAQPVHSVGRATNGLELNKWGCIVADGAMQATNLPTCSPAAASLPEARR